MPENVLALGLKRDGIDAEGAFTEVGDAGTAASPEGRGSGEEGEAATPLWRSSSLTRLRVSMYASRCASNCLINSGRLVAIVGSRSHEERQAIVEDMKTVEEAVNMIQGDKDLEAVSLVEVGSLAR
jgi:hypothetical protein